MTGSAAAGAYCRNCDLFLGEKPGNYCPHCGQDTHAHPPSFGEFLHEFVTHYIALEGRLARTLGLLFLRPGELTVRYFAGRKNSYVLPLRLYITASLLFFIVVKFFGAGSLVKGGDASGNAPSTGAPVIWQSESGGVKLRPAGPPGVVLSNLPPEERNRALADLVQCDPAPDFCNQLKARLESKYGRQSNIEVWRQVKDKIVTLAPYAMFLMLPLFALITKLLYVKRAHSYGEHVVYALHVHAFTYFLLLAVAVASEAIAGWLMWGGALYYVLAMRRVFGGRWWATALRFFAIGSLYPVLLGFVIVATLAFALFI
ncbi:MAG: DUF3667 domain-containing protein [Betaproteobacteria bacterium]|nr:DUF3667 domain-containing protein [Betaproteobacteria bacterium]